MSWDELVTYLLRNIDYWGWYVSQKTSIEKDDAMQELLITVWKQYCNNEKKGKKITVYYMQKRLQWGASRIIKEFYNNLVNSWELGEDVVDPRSERDFFSEWTNSLFDKLKDNLKADKEFKALDILMFMLEGNSQKDIAEELDLTQKHLSVYISRKIKLNLKSILEKDGVHALPGNYAKIEKNSGNKVELLKKR